MKVIDFSDPRNYPDPDCAHCGGEGVDGDPAGYFDYDVRAGCPHCWSEDEFFEDDADFADVLLDLGFDE